MIQLIRVRYNIANCGHIPGGFGNSPCIQYKLPSVVSDPITNRPQRRSPSPPGPNSTLGTTARLPMKTWTQLAMDPLSMAFDIPSIYTGQKVPEKYEKELFNL